MKIKRFLSNCYSAENLVICIWVIVCLSFFIINDKLDKIEKRQRTAAAMQIMNLNKDIPIKQIYQIIDSLEECY